MTTEYPSSLFPGVALPPPPPVRRRDFIRAADAVPLRDRLAAWREAAARRKVARSGKGVAK